MNIPLQIVITIEQYNICRCLRWIYIFFLNTILCITQIALLHQTLARVQYQVYPKWYIQVYILWQHCLVTIMILCLFIYSFFIILLFTYLFTCYYYYLFGVQNWNTSGNRYFFLFLKIIYLPTFILFVISVLPIIIM